LLFGSDFSPVNSDHPIGTNHCTVGAPGTFSVDFSGKMITFAVDFLRHRNYRKGTRSYANLTSFAAFRIDHDIACNFSHSYSNYLVFKEPRRYRNFFDPAGIGCKEKNGETEI